MKINRTEKEKRKNSPINQLYHFELNNYLGTFRFAAISLAMLLSSLFVSCGIYSFIGISTNAKTFTVHFIANQAPVVVPSLSQTLTDALKNKFLTSANIALTQIGGDLEFSGAITDYQVSPVAAQANETAALNRLTISVNIDFVNHKNEKQSWTTVFSRYADYNSSADFASVQDQLIKEINEQLGEDIFNKAVVNW